MRPLHDINSAHGSPGTTLIELIMAIALLTVISTMVVVHLNENIRVQKETKTDQLIISQLDGMVRSYVNTFLRQRLRNSNERGAGYPKRCRLDLYSATDRSYAIGRVNQAGAAVPEIGFETLSGSLLTQLTGYSHLAGSEDAKVKYRQAINECRSRGFLWKESGGVGPVTPTSRDFNICLFVSGLRGSSPVHNYADRYKALIQVNMQWYSVLRETRMSCRSFYNDTGSAGQARVQFKAFWGFLVSKENYRFNYKVRSFVTNEG